MTENIAVVINPHTSVDMKFSYSTWKCCWKRVLPRARANSRRGRSTPHKPGTSANIETQHKRIGENKESSRSHVEAKCVKVSGPLGAWPVQVAGLNRAHGPAVGDRHSSVSVLHLVVRAALLPCSCEEPFERKNRTAPLLCADWGFYILFGPALVSEIPKEGARSTRLSSVRYLVDYVKCYCYCWIFSAFKCDSQMQDFTIFFTTLLSVVFDFNITSRMLMLLRCNCVVIWVRRSLIDRFENIKHE